VTLFLKLSALPMGAFVAYQVYLMVKDFRSSRRLRWKKN
jgi:hypothetical protein